MQHYTPSYLLDRRWRSFQKRMLDGLVFGPGVGVAAGRGRVLKVSTAGSAVRYGRCAAGSAGRSTARQRLA